MNQSNFSVQLTSCEANFFACVVPMISLIHLIAWQASFFIFSSKALLRMGRLELLFTSFTNSLQPRRNVQSSHVKGFNKARGMLLVIGVGHREAKSYKAQLPSGALTVFVLVLWPPLHILLPICACKPHRCKAVPFALFWPLHLFWG